MLSLRNYTACNQINLRHYYSLTDRPLLCGLCRDKNKHAALCDYPLADGHSHWYVCAHCGFAGTGIEYLARLNHRDIGQQIHEMSQEGRIPPVELDDIQKYKKFREEWAELKKQFAAADPFRRHTTIALADMYDLDTYPPAQSFRQATRQTFERWFHSSMKHKKHNTSGSRLFHGLWAKITAIPLYDMPLHLSGILFINGHEQGNQQYHIRRLGPFSGKQYLFDPGFLGTRMICRPDQSAVVLCPQWQLVLTLQAAIFRQEGKYPPLLGWFPTDPRADTPYTYSWTGIKDIPKVFWALPDDLASLREACIQNGKISCAHFSHTGKFTPPDKLYGGLIRSVIKNADPWYKTLTWYLEGDMDHFEDRLRKLHLPARTIEQYLEHAPAAVRNKLAAVPADPHTPARYIDGNRVVSNQEGWWKMGSGLNRSLLSNTRCRIDKVIHTAADQPIYQGKVFIGHEEYPFTEQETLFEKHPIPTVKKVCVENGCIQFLRINVKNEQYLRLVKETSTPETVYCLEGYGWSKKEAALLLPNVTISAGTVIDTTLSLQTGPLHKLTVKQSQPIGSSHHATLANFQEETPVIFSIFSAIIPALFSSAYRMTPPQTVVAGNEFLMVKQVCDMIGLPQIPLRNREEIERYTCLHRCPFLVRFHPRPKRKKITHEWADILGLTTPALVWTSITEAIARMSYGKANLLLLPGTHFYRWFDGKLPNLFQDCFMACLRHISQYVLDPTDHTDDWNGDLLEETGRFFAKEVGVAPAKNALFGGYYAQSDYFYDYVNLLYRAELIVLHDKKVSVSDLAECYRKHIGVFDFQKFYEELRGSKAIGEYDTKSQTLVLDEENLTKSNRRLEKFYGTLLRN
jgi:hypothetical protein